MTAHQLILLALKVSIMLNVFALGLRATVSDATYMLSHPAELGQALVSMNLVMPAVAIGLNTVLDLSPPVQIALVALSLSPVPPLFPRRVMKAGAQENYAVGLITAVAALSIVVLPLSLAILERLRDVPLRMPLEGVVKLVLMTVLVPLLAGIAVRAAAPSFAERAAKPLTLLSVVLLVLGLAIVLPRVASLIPTLVGNRTLIGMVLFACIGFAVGHALGGPDPEHRYTLAVATSSRHPMIAFTLAEANFPGNRLTLPAILLYFITSALCGLVFARMHRAGPSTSATSSAARPALR